jgi:hypothetical protein
MTEIAIAGALVALGAMGWDGWRRWLARDSSEYEKLRAGFVERERSVDLRDDQWTEKFAGLERRTGAVETALRGLEPKFQPLGKHYSPRSAG